MAGEETGPFVARLSVLGVVELGDVVVSLVIGCSDWSHVLGEHMTVVVGHCIVQ